MLMAGRCFGDKQPNRKDRTNPNSRTNSGNFGEQANGKPQCAGGDIRGRRLPGIARLMTKASDPCLENQTSALTSDSGLRYFCSQRDCAVRRPKLEPNPYNPMSPSQIPRNVVRIPIRGSRAPLADTLAASKVAPSS